MAKKVIQVNKVNKSFGRVKAVDDLTFDVERGECVGLLGPNGAGKTTMLKIIYGKAVPDTNGDTVIDIFGCHPRNQALQIKSFSGIVPQQDNLDVELNVEDNLLIYSRFYGMDRLKARNRIKELIIFMELQDKARVKIKELSGGMQRRLTIARALLNAPQLLILDEPTTGLDPQVRHLIWNKIRELKEMGVTVLLTTHYMDEAFQICDRIIIMDHGRKMMEGPPRILVEENLEKYVMEIHGLDREQASDLLKSRHQIRWDFQQDTLFVFGGDHGVLSGLAAGMKSGDYHLRQANLEDLFLKVTGRSLNEQQ